MIKEISDRKTPSWKCEECFLSYPTKKWAILCEEWCKKHKSCNLEITLHALKNKGGKI